MDYLWQFLVTLVSGGASGAAIYKVFSLYYQAKKDRLEFVAEQHEVLIKHNQDVIDRLEKKVEGLEVALQTAKDKLTAKMIEHIETVSRMNQQCQQCQFRPEANGSTGSSSSKTT